MNVDNNIKQIIVVRRKFPDGKGGYRGINCGKSVAQGGHGVLAFLNGKLVENFKGYWAKLNQTQFYWLLKGQAKVTLQADMLEELEELHQKALALGLDSHLVTDHGLTEFNGVPTVTVLAIGPHNVEDFQGITDHLKLY